jgi:hypothetical protein
MNNIILLIIFTLSIYVIIYNKKENFNNIPYKNTYINNPTNTSTVNTYNMPYIKPELNGTINLKPEINSKQAIISHNNYSLLNDPLFKDVIYYENNNESGRLGLDMCIELCNGNCVEYGQTGNAYCFPKKIEI